MMVEQEVYIVYNSWRSGDFYPYGVFVNEDEAKKCAEENGHEMGKHHFPASIMEATLYITPTTT